ncbi:hypothetical protein J5N97_016399 [Dioscorea zingiberensis]|uniref:Uncharacterized protein n=1 Tax=Dioscorea zingiberensis TaxID=325984 RepID=A0A9D5HFC9_9LILI|nr:hypothetical protein J5N97_016399 [Dioscorea zingiberensis]
MGCCFSKRRSLPPPPPAPNPISIDVSHVKHVVEKKKEKEKEEVVVVVQCQQAFEEKKQVSNCSNVVTTPEKKAEPLVVVVEEQQPLPVRTSSCTKEEVDAILIQCGRLSRSSSGKTSNEVGGGSRRYSGSKRSYDFDEERRKGEGEEEEKLTSRPSPRRRTPGRERSGSRERDRRVSRSPGRRSDCPGSASASASASGSNGDRLKQPAKMVSVPPREKGSISVASAGKRSASPSSRSMANSGRTSNENAHPSQPQSLSRSSSRKAEQSPNRRNPMAEIDDNTLRREQPALRSKGVKSREGEEVVRKPIQAQTQRTGGEISNGIKNSNNVFTDCVRDQLMNCRAKEQQPEIREESIEEKGALKSIVEIPILGTITRTRSSRRSSRDLDHNPISYASLLLEDIQNYHHQNNTAISLPACVSKACSILEAVADLNSSFSDNKSYVDGDQHSNHDNGFARRGLLASEPFVESEIVVKDDLMEPSLHKYVSVRELGGEMEPQESAGSNSFIGQTWASPWDPNSVDSKEQCWSTSRSTTNFKEAKEEEFSPVSYNNSQSGKQQKPVSDAPERRLRGGSSNLSNASRKRELDRKVTARASALHSAAAASS